MKAAVLYKVNDLRIEERPRPVPGPEEVLIRVKAVGVCGSDMHWYAEGHIGDNYVTEPLVLGHEAAGEVVEVGANVKGWQAGDRVALEPGLYCRRCDFCKRGDYNLCRDGVYQSSPGADGFFAEYVTMPWDKVFRLPDHLDWIEGAMIEPFVVGLMAARQGDVQAGQAVAILGSGPIGLFTLQAALAYGASNVIVTDVEDKRLAVAKELGATHIVNAARASTADEIVRLTGGRGADVVFEAAGAVPTAQQSVYAVRRGGTIVLVGMFSQGSFTMDMIRIIRSQLTIRSVFRYANQYPVAIALAGAGRVNLKLPVTHTFPLDQVKEALDFGIQHKDIAIKVAVTL